MGIFLRRGRAPVLGTALGDIAIGSLVKLNEASSPVDYYVAKHGYEDTLNGSSRTLLVRKECYKKNAWGRKNENAYAESIINDWLCNTYPGLLDANIRTMVGNTIIYYTIGNGDGSISTMSVPAFALSATELGRSASNANVEGEALPIASLLQKATLDGEGVQQWTRTPHNANTASVYYLTATAGMTTYSPIGVFGFRPCITLPSTTIVGDDMLIA